MECGFFARLETHLTIHFSQKNRLKHTGTATYNNALNLLNKVKCPLFRSNNAFRSNNEF